MTLYIISISLFAKIVKMFFRYFEEMIGDIM